MKNFEIEGSLSLVFATEDKKTRAGLAASEDGFSFSIQNDNLTISYKNTWENIGVAVERLKSRKTPVLASGE